MKVASYLAYLVNEIHSTIVATVDDNGLPVTCAIDMMDADESSLYFLTAKGKSFYHRLKKREYLALTGIKGEDTMSCVALTVQGKVREIGPGMLFRLFEKNPYMNEIYPDEISQKALTVFQLYEGTGEWFDLSKKPIERETFAFGGVDEIQDGYYINSGCINCGACQMVCPQKCIDIQVKPAVIKTENCLHCGNCYEACPVGAIEKRGL